MTVRGRFAPSPTGRLHLGNARTALLSWLQVRAAGGTFLLRIEDLDPGRSRSEHVDALFADLEYLGLTWDETPIRQSERNEAYRAALETLQARGALYRCVCTRAEIGRAASAPHGPGDEGPRYPGTCLLRSEAQLAERAAVRPPALRFRPRAGTVCFDDQVHGRTCQDVEQEVGDFVVRRNDGVASYQLAVVVDDAESGITDVLRADDLLNSTPRQLLLYEALGHTPPRFAHVPLVLGEDGGRLAKREGAATLSSLRESGVPSERVVGLLAGLSGLHDGSPVPAEALVAGFSVRRLTRAPATLTDEALAALVHG